MGEEERELLRMEKRLKEERRRKEAEREVERKRKDAEWEKKRKQTEREMRERQKEDRDRRKRDAEREADKRSKDAERGASPPHDNMRGETDFEEVCLNEGVETSIFGPSLKVKSSVDFKSMLSTTIIK